MDIEMKTLLLILFPYLLSSQPLSKFMDQHPVLKANDQAVDFYATTLFCGAVWHSMQELNFPKKSWQKIFWTEVICFGINLAVQQAEYKRPFNVHLPASDQGIEFWAQFIWICWRIPVDDFTGKADHCHKQIDTYYFDNLNMPNCY